MKKESKSGVRIEVPVGRLDITGTTLLAYADRYRQAAQVLIHNSLPESRFDPVPYYLLCLSLELQQKAFLWLKDGIGTKTMKRKYGHNIEKLWRDSKARGIQKYATVSPLRDRAIGLVGPYYKDRQFNYVDVRMIASGFHKLRAEPKVIPALDRLAAQLSKSLRTPVLRHSS